VTSPNARFYVIAILIVLGIIWILASYARLILCAWRREPWAVYPRAAGDLCRSCAGVFDTQVQRVGRRVSLLRRLTGRRAA
jgi:hypothetical protein